MYRLCCCCLTRASCQILELLYAPQNALLKYLIWCAMPFPFWCENCKRRDKSNFLKSNGRRYQCKFSTFNKKRWRNIGATKLYFFPNQKTAVPSSRKTTTRSTMDTHRKVAFQPKPSQEPLGELFDRFLKIQKDDVTAYSSGYLNSSITNQRLAKERDKSRGKPLFGMDKDAHDKNLFDMLEQFDSVKLRKPVSPELAPLEADKARTIKKTKSEKSSHTFFTPLHFSLTKHDQYKTVSAIDSTLVENGRKIRFNDIGKQEKLKEYQRFLVDELEANECPKRGPHLVRLQIYSQCFEKLIQEFTTYGPLLADIKVMIERLDTERIRYHCGKF
jgi:hypothetical protein